MSDFGIFGAKVKELPAVTHARTVLGVGRNATYDEVRSVWRKLVMQWHPDKHRDQPTEPEATLRTEMYTKAYHLLTVPEERQRIHLEFADALQQPMVVGDRIFSLGSLYGMRIFVPKQYQEKITDPSKLLGGSSGEGVPGYKEHQGRIFYGVRRSIMESELADQLETFYGGKVEGYYHLKLQEAFEKRSEGGMDDLRWIQSNELALFHFLERKFHEAANVFMKVNEEARDNVIFMFRYGVSLEAMVAQEEYKSRARQKWINGMEMAIGLYAKALKVLNARHFSYVGPPGHEQRIPKHDPRSKLTVMMQLADAYQQLGEKRAARKLWRSVKKINPACVEARMKAQSLLASLPRTGLRKLLTYIKS